MTDATELDIDAVKARLEAATEGPWDFWCSDDGRLEMYVPNGTMSTETVLYFLDHEDCPDCARLSPEDATFVSHARTDIPLLLTALDEAREGEALMKAFRRRAFAAEVEVHDALARATAAESARDAAEGALRNVRARIQALVDGGSATTYVNDLRAILDRLAPVATDETQGESR